MFSKSRSHISAWLAVVALLIAGGVKAVADEPGLPHSKPALPGTPAPSATAEAGPPLHLIEQITLDGKVLGSNVRRVTWSPDGKTLTGITSVGLLLWDFTPAGLHKKGQNVLLEHFTRMANSPVVYSPDGKLLVAAGDDNLLRLYSVEKGGNFKLLSTGEGHDRTVMALAFSHDGKTIISGGDDMAVILWDLTNNQLTQRDLFKVTTGIFGIKSLGFAPDDKRFSVSNGSGDVFVVDLVDGKLRVNTTFNKPGGDWSLPMAVSPTTGELLIGSQKDVWIWSAKTSASFRAHDEYITAVAWSGDGKYFATTADDGRLIIWDADGKTRYTLHRPSKFVDVKFGPTIIDPSGKTLWVAAVSDNGNIYLLHLDVPAAAGDHPPGIKA